MKYLSLLFVLFTGMLCAQVVENGVLTDKVTTFINSMPSGVGGNQYTVPSSSQQTTWSSVVSSLLASNYAAAHTSAQQIGYRIVQFTDTVTTKLYYLAEKLPDSVNYWGLYIFDQSAVRQRVVIQSPHPLYDSFTGLQSLQIFTTAGARCLMISGTHRCNATALSSCAGTTTVCTGSDTNFTKSDHAHNTDGMMYLTTTAMTSSITDLAVIQPHGFSQDTGDPDIILSNGTRKTPGATDYALLLKNELLQIDDTLTFKVVHVDTTWNKLTGTTNVQGRHINGSNNPCNSSASSSSGRFIHIEQSYALRNSQSARQKLADAVTATFPEDPLPVEVISFYAVVSEGLATLYWKTVTETNNAGFYIEQRVPGSDEFIRCGFVQGNGTVFSAKEYSFVVPLQVTGLYQFRLVQLDTDGSFTMGNIIEVVSSRINDVYLYPVYPNPASESITVTFRLHKKEPVQITVYDVLGKKVSVVPEFFKERGEHRVVVNVKNLGAGVYVLSLRSSVGTLTTKLVVR